MLPLEVVVQGHGRPGLPPAVELIPPIRPDRHFAVQHTPAQRTGAAAAGKVGILHEDIPVDLLPDRSRQRAAVGVHLDQFVRIDLRYPLGDLVHVIQASVRHAGDPPFARVRRPVHPGWIQFFACFTLAPVAGRVHGAQGKGFRPWIVPEVVQDPVNRVVSQTRVRDAELVHELRPQITDGRPFSLDQRIPVGMVFEVFRVWGDYSPIGMAQDLDPTVAPVSTEIIGLLFRKPEAVEPVSQAPIEIIVRVDVGPAHLGTAPGEEVLRHDHDPPAVVVRRFDFAPRGNQGFPTGHDLTQVAGNDPPTALLA